MAGIGRVNGHAAPGAWYGYSPVVVKVAATGKFTADAVSGTGVITDGGYANAVKALQQFGSIVWLGARDVDSFCAIVDKPSFNQGNGQGGSLVDADNTDLSALNAALVDACGAATYTITTATVLNGDGTFAF